MLVQFYQEIQGVEKVKGQALMIFKLEENRRGIRSKRSTGSLREDQAKRRKYVRQRYLCGLKSLRLTRTDKNRAGRIVLVVLLGLAQLLRFEFKKAPTREKSMRFRCRYAYPFIFVSWNLLESQRQATSGKQTDSIVTGKWENGDKWHYGVSLKKYIFEVKFEDLEIWRSKNRSSIHHWFMWQSSITMTDRFDENWKTFKMKTQETSGRTEVSCWIIREDVIASGSKLLVPVTGWLRNYVL